MVYMPRSVEIQAPLPAVAPRFSAVTSRAEPLPIGLVPEQFFIPFVRDDVVRLRRASQASVLQALGAPHVLRP